MNRKALCALVAVALMAGGCRNDPEENPYNEESGDLGPAAAADSTPYSDDVVGVPGAAPVAEP